MRSICEANISIAILSLAVAAIRLSVIGLRRLPPFINVLYDVVLVALWCFNLATQTSARKFPECHVERFDKKNTPEICYTFNKCVIVSIVALAFYCGRLAIDIRAMTAPRLRASPVPLGDLEGQELKIVQSAAVSPILAFFSETTDVFRRSVGSEEGGTHTAFGTSNAGVHAPDEPNHASTRTKTRSENGHVTHGGKSSS